MKTAKISRKFAGFNLDDEVRREEAEKAKKPEETPAIPKATDNEFRIISTWGAYENSYALQNVPIRGAYVDLMICLDKLCRGETHTIDQWMDPCNHDRQGLRPWSGVEFYSICRALYNNRHDKHASVIDKVRSKLETIFKEGEIATGTQVVYRPDELFVSKLMIHHEKEPVRLLWNGTPRDNPFEEAQDDMIPALFGSNDRAEINSVIKWVSGREPGISYSASVDQETSKYLAIGGPAQHFFLSADTDPSIKMKAIGIVIGGPQ